MGPGRPRIPTKIHQLRGIPGNRPLNNDPEPTAQIPKCPPIIKGEAKKEWRRICKELFALGLMTNLDRAAMTMYCRSWQRWLKAEEKLDAEGDPEISLSPNGYAQQSSWYTIANKEHAKLCKILTEYGMTSAARSRINVTPSKKLPKGAMRFLA